MPRSTFVLAAVVPFLLVPAGDALGQQPRHGALAVDRNNGFYFGFAHDHPSDDAARSTALAECARAGGQCEAVLAWSGSGCGAYRTIAGDVGTAYGWGLAATAEQADAIALQQATVRSNGRPATNHVWACNAADAGPVQSLFDAAAADDPQPMRFLDVDGNPYTYTGPLVDGKPHGQGVAVWDGGARYEGSFVAGMKEGPGRAEWPSGSRYDGEWSGDLQHGQGVNVFPTGHRYEGAFQQGKRHGTGRLYGPDGALMYDGRYVDNDRVD